MLNKNKLNVQKSCNFNTMRYKYFIGGRINSERKTRSRNKSYIYV